MSLFIFIISLCLLVLFHELGHFSMARLFNVAIETFSIGFGKAWFSFTDRKHQTEFRITPILLGGYVRFAEDASRYSRKVLIRDLALWKQLLILLAGPFANLLLAFLTLVVFFKLGSYSPLPYVGDLKEHALASQIGFNKGQRILAVNDHVVNSWMDVIDNTMGQTSIKFSVLDSNLQDKHELFFNSAKPLSQKQDFFQWIGFNPLLPKIPAVVGDIQKKSTADIAGIAIGDKIISIDNLTIDHMAQLSEYVRAHPNVTVTLRWIHDSKELSKKVILQSRIEQQKHIGLLGVSSPTFDKFPQWFHYTQYSWSDAFQKATVTAWNFLSVQLGVWLHFNEQVANISGPLGMARAADHAWSAGIKMYLLYIVWLNVGLAVINLLPIPILDGGQCVVLILKKIFPRAFNDQHMKWISICSFLLLSGLFLLGLSNDWSF